MEDDESRRQITRENMDLRLQASQDGMGEPVRAAVTKMNRRCTVQAHSGVPAGVRHSTGNCRTVKWDHTPGIHSL